MRLEQLKEEIAIEQDWLKTIVDEVVQLHKELSYREPTIREKTAASAFLAQFYTGIENILKRIAIYERIPLPQGENWHITLFKQFSETNNNHLGVTRLPR